MKVDHVRALLSATVAALVTSSGFCRAAESDEVLVLSFFRDNGQAGIFLAASEDGLHFTPLNNDQPVMKSAPWEGQQLTRDPSIVFHAGTFHAVWTTSWKGNCFGYAESKDLVHWSAPVRVEPFSTTQKPRNMWAPEICWDGVQKNFMIFWSSTVSPLGHQIFVTRTADGKNFSEAKLFLDQKFSCIDGMLARDEDATPQRWVLVYKNEEAIAKGGKNLRLATAPADFSQPWTHVSQPIVGPDSGMRPQEMAEGPSLLKWRGSWYLYWDAFANKHYSLASSTDLKNWTDRTAELQLPPHPRHGTIFHAPRAAVGWLQKSGSDKKP